MIRFFALLLFFALPPTLIGFLLFGVMGAVVGLALGDLVLVFVGLRTERVVSRFLRAGELADIPLQRTFERVVTELETAKDYEVMRPEVWLYPDALPNALAVRGFGGDGSIFLSQGLVAQLTEAEIRAVLKTSLLRLQESQWVLNSLCAGLAIRIFRRMPVGWKKLLFSSAQSTRQEGESLTVWNLVVFLLLFPFGRFFQRLCIRIPIEQSQDGLTPEDKNAWQDAVRKIRTAAERAGHVENPGASVLFLISPDPADRIL